MAARSTFRLVDETGETVQNKPAKARDGDKRPPEQDARLRDASQPKGCQEP